MEGMRFVAGMAMENAYENATAAAVLSSVHHSTTPACSYPPAVFQARASELATSAGNEACRYLNLPISK